ncbi:helix-turn-helix domain containing protein [Enterococcus thailandicus]|uniref:helix-turn-helix domain containing protein n=1 Tax=Enterococcus thailandicus TaxID=417368 RepID=UPI002891BC15|nr:helix-turn-helix domain containing protein [Enterococcus thailandicus]MDT2752313.1 helix-turn-helix domain containing protein [Enterococcus thailandicus]MDT2776806.1 helix-turn-helix domain containing protein [Enterococcus thailandicus]
MKSWTTKEISYIKRYALLAETNQVLNAKEMAKKLNRSLKAVEMKIYSMQRDGQLPKVDMSKAFDTSRRPYSSTEDVRIMAMYKKGENYKTIGEAVGRSESAIAGRITRLKQKGKIKKSSQKVWSESEVQTLLETIDFDEHGYVCNYDELTQKLKRRYEQVVRKVTVLRKQGRIQQRADRSKTSVKSKRAMNKFNEARFAQYKNREVEPMKTNPVETKHIPAFSVNSMEVTVILTSVVLDGREIQQQYFTKDGQLIVQKELTPSANEVSQ